MVTNFKYLGKVPLCNGRADRGLYVRGFCLPLCARCTGLLAGSVAGTIVLHMTKPELRPIPALIAGAALIVPTAVDGILEYAAGYESTNRRRLVTGTIAGIGCTLVEQTILPITWQMPACSTIGRAA